MKTYAVAFQEEPSPTRWQGRNHLELVEREHRRRHLTVRWAEYWAKKAGRDDWCVIESSKGEVVRYGPAFFVLSKPLPLRSSCT